jgi:lipid-A-disaccharide synthase
MQEAGVRLLARTDSVSAMGWTGLIPILPRLLRTLAQTARGSRDPLPACVVAVDVWQPLRFLHRKAPHLAAVPHVCYLPPGPNFVGPSRLHGAVARAFRAVVTPFAHQRRLYADAGANVLSAAHAGLLALRQELTPPGPREREPVLALLPGSRELEIRYSLPVQYAAAQGIIAKHPDLKPVVCCADERVEARARRLFPELEVSRRTREVLARARFGIICSGTAVLEAALLGCPGVVTYHGSPLQRWEWRTFHIEKLARLRKEGIASPYVALPNIISGRELYPELLDAPCEPIADRALECLARDPLQAREALDAVGASLSWDDPGEVIGGAIEEIFTSGLAEAPRR